jgi:hypothetical protein
MTVLQNSQVYFKIPFFLIFNLTSVKTSSEFRFLFSFVTEGHFSETAIGTKALCYKLFFVKALSKRLQKLMIMTTQLQ